VHDGIIQGTLGKTGFSKLPENVFTNTTLRSWFGGGEPSKNVENMDLTIWAQEQSFIIAPADSDGVNANANVKLELTDSSGATVAQFDTTGQMYDPYYEISIGRALGASNLKITNVDGSNFALIEVFGSSDYPMLVYANPREVIEIKDSFITFGSQLYSRSATIQETILFYFGDSGVVIYLPQEQSQLIL
jgi:hypothetical protein